MNQFIYELTIAKVIIPVMESNDHTLKKTKDKKREKEVTESQEKNEKSILNSEREVVRM